LSIKTGVNIYNVDFAVPHVMF